MDNEAIQQAAATQRDPRVQLAFERTFLAYERTRIAWVRTALSLISFGFVIGKFFQDPCENGVKQRRCSAQAIGRDDNDWTGRLDPANWQERRA